MSREDRWIAVSGGLSVVVWGALGWILLDPDLQGVREGIGGWMIAIAVAPLLIMGVGMAVLDESEDGDRVSSAEADDHDSGWLGEYKCGGCGG
ncbi:hypothetical protein [Streptomyces sp. TLI_105]|uniref:hypothetical protein n=1 Tax=Streptomyces sp. TLI_105 TaxID=1881019 RepID=UPI000896E884|nr:hypothetical protein [Streptomyces sp. TLI_105]SEB65064.1 hypothetical protein SAMN05428939_0324 [Streptomyces sp. TLI_105]